jgi:hypothetical protein
MKALSLVILILVLSVVASAQTPADTADAPGVSVSQPKWRQYVRNPALDDDPFRANDEQKELMRVQNAINKENAARSRQGRDLIRPARAVNSDIPSNETTVTYIYEANVSNTGEKQIKALVWEYVLFDPATQREVGNHRFKSEASIRSGKSKRLSGYSTSPPATVVDATKADKPKKGQYSERVVIHGIEYADGTAWQRPSN